MERFHRPVNVGGGSGSQWIVYQFSRDKMERGNLTAFLVQFGADRLLAGPALATMLGCLAFTAEGYDADPRGIYAIPEVGRSTPNSIGLGSARDHPLGCSPSGRGRL